MKFRPLLGAIAAALAVTAIVIGLRDARRLGPADGQDLPAVDTGRVGVADTAPDFTLASNGGERFTLSAMRGRRDVILLFYRGRL